VSFRHTQYHYEFEREISYCRRPFLVKPQIAVNVSQLDQNNPVTKYLNYIFVSPDH